MSCLCTDLHRLVIGLTLVVAGDSFFLTLFVVILFHQVFEGLALGSRIATIGTAADSQLTHGHGVFNNGSAAQDTDKSANSPTAETMRIPSSSEGATAHAGLSMKKKLGLASLFAFITPIGMAIGIGVLHKFNGNDRSTLLAIGTLDALSAGILVWVGRLDDGCPRQEAGARRREPLDGRPRGLCPRRRHGADESTREVGIERPTGGWNHELLLTVTVDTHFSNGDGTGGRDRQDLMAMCDGYAGWIEHVHCSGQHQQYLAGTIHIRQM